MECYLVGGAVRDQLLGLAINEQDWVVVGATPQDLLKKGYKQVGKDFPVFIHPDTGEEYALARTERKIAPGYQGFSFDAEKIVTLEEDLMRRDLTINAIAQDDKGNLIDPYGGVQDLQDKVFRHVSAAFTEDPLRVLRVARFMARFHHLGFTIASETFFLLKDISKSGELTALSPERVWNECQKALMEDSPNLFFDVLHQCGALEVLFPMLEDRYVSKTPFAALQTASKKNESLVIRYTALAIDFQYSPEENSQMVSQLNHTYPIPKGLNALSKLLAEQQTRLMKTMALNAEELLTGLERMDVFRRQSRFNDILNAFEILLEDSDVNTDSNHTRIRLVDALAFAKKVNADVFVKQGLQGDVIAKALHEARKNEIEKGIFG